MTCQTNDCRTNLWSWHKTIRRHIRNNIWFCVILHSEGKCPVIFGPRSHLHPICHLFLHHDSNTFNRYMAFKQAHNNRCRNIIRQICYHFDRLVIIIFLCKFWNIHFQHIVIDHSHIVVCLQRILQDRNQCFVDLHRHNLSCSTCEILCHRPDSRSDLQHKVILRNLC